MKNKYLKEYGEVSTAMKVYIIFQFIEKCFLNVFIFKILCKPDKI